MLDLLRRTSAGPIGLDLGTRAVKLVQLNHERTKIIEAARWDLPPEATVNGAAKHAKQVAALKQAREGRRFRGRDVVVSLGARELFVQNVRVSKGSDSDIDRAVRQEASSRVPFPSEEAELRYLEAADVRQGETMRREVILLACHRPVLQELLRVVEDAGLRPRAVEIEAAALLRCYGAQFRRDEDRDQRWVLVHIGNSNTAVIIAQGEEVLFFKYIELGGRHFDDAVSRHLHMAPTDAWALRRHNGDRRADQQDPEVARSVGESIRPIIDRLVNEVSMCVRYHNVTFRGQPLRRMVLAGGEATPALVERFAGTVDFKCELGDPARTFESANLSGRSCQWDLAIGMALKTVE